jgi:hypothetical protein
VGAYGAAGGNAALKALRDELLKRAMLEQQQKQQTFQNDLALRGANRADAQLSAQQENNSLIRQGQAEARAETERKNKEAAAKDRYNQAAGLRESLPPETPLGLDNPALAQMAQDAPGLMGTLRMAQAPSMGPDFQGPMPGDQFGPETPQQAQTGGLRGYLTMATQKQAEKAADDTRQADQAKQNAKYQDALMAQMGQKAQPDPEIQDLKKMLLQEQLKAAQGKNAPPQESPYSQERTRRIMQSVDDLSNRVSGMTVGAGGSLMSYLPGSTATDFDADLKTLKSNIAYGELAEMRAASKTGGALGAVSDKETALLESALGALDTRQSPANFKKNLAQIKNSLEIWSAAKSGAQPTQGGPTAEDLIKKYSGVR